VSKPCPAPRQYKFPVSPTFAPPTIPGGSTSSEPDYYIDDVTHLQLQRHHQVVGGGQHGQQQQQQQWQRGHHVPRYVTRTVSGFMDFVTTVGNTVIVFTPQAAQPGTLTTST
jgi:hypothetical protein